MIDRSVPPEYFEQIYATNPDPWDYATSVYERHKYTATLRALPRARFKSAFEPGCSIGVLTRMLARRCETLLAVDMSETSLALARAHCRHSGNIRFGRMRLPVDWPAGTFDLVVLSEVLYYQSRGDGRTTARRLPRTLRAGAVVVLVHWLGETGAPRSGDEAARQFIGQTRRHLRVIARTRNSRYRLDILARRDLVSGCPQ